MWPKVRKDTDSFLHEALKFRSFKVLSASAAAQEPTEVVSGSRHSSFVETLPVAVVQVKPMDRSLRGGWAKGRIGNHMDI